MAEQPASDNTPGAMERNHTPAAALVIFGYRRYAVAPPPTRPAPVPAEPISPEDQTRLEAYEYLEHRKWLLVKQHLQDFQQSRDYCNGLSQWMPNEELPQSDRGIWKEICEVDEAQGMLQADFQGNAGFLTEYITWLRARYC